MAEDIKEQIRLLVELQGFETESFSLGKKLEKIPGVLKEFDERLGRAEQEVLEASEALEILKKEYREHESEIQANQSKINKSQEKLGLVKNNKEYQATLKEIEELQVKNAQVEDNMLEILDKIDVEELNIKAKKGALKQFSTEIELQKVDTEQERLEWEKKLMALGEARDGIIQKIDPEYLKRFDQVKKVVGIVAIARAVDSVCLGCHMNIPPQRYNELQRLDSLQFCPNCHRIIYWKNNNIGSE